MRGVQLFVLASAAAALALLFTPYVGGPRPAAAAPANDLLAGAVAIATPTTSGIVATGTNVGAALEGGEVQPCGSIGATVWYTWTSPASPGTVVFDTWGSDFDTVLAIYTGGGFPLANVGCEDDVFPFNTPSALTLSYAASTTYRIQVGGFSGATGNLVLNMSLGAAIYVNNTADTNVSDGVLTLREAMLLASDGTGGGGLGRALSGPESTLVLNAAAMGATGSDLIHFAPNNFPPSTGATIVLGSSLPALNTGSDAVSGIGAGVIIDGQDWSIVCVGIDSDGNVVEGLDLRRCDTGIAIGTGSGNRIGGSLIPAQANFISGSDETGILIGVFSAATGNSVVGNVIGFRRDGILDIFQFNSVGIRLYFGGAFNTIGGSGPGEGNVVSLSTADGIQVFDDNNVIIGNKIGTDPTGSFGYGNIGYGISVGSDGNIIGGIGPGEGNIIASNSQWGVDVSGNANTIRGNSIHSNSSGGIVGSGATIGLPVISSVSANAVSGTACGLCTVDIYSDTGGQGRVYVGVTTADALGVFAATGIAHPLGNVTATATVNSGTYAGSTSRFSDPFAAATNLDGDGLFDVVDACVSVPEDEDGFQDADGCPDPDNDMDGICDPGQASVSCTGSDSGKQVFDPAGTLPSPTIDCRNIPEDYDAFRDSDGCPEPDNDNDAFPDYADNCPGTGQIAGADGMLGAPQDLNHNGVKDVSEAAFATDDSVLVFEDYDGVLDGDGCHDSPGDDFDGDSFGILQAGLPIFHDEHEALFLGTAAYQPCAATPTADDEPGPDAWPFDFNDDQRAALADVMRYIPVFNAVNGDDPAYSTRFDFNADGRIALADVMLFIQVFNQTCLR